MVNRIALLLGVIAVINLIIALVGGPPVFVFNSHAVVTALISTVVQVAIAVAYVALTRPRSHSEQVYERH